MRSAVAGQFRFQGELYSILAFAVRTSRASARTAFALTAHPETYMMDVENETKASQQRTTEERTTVVRRRSLDERANFCCS